jgi:Holliday junction DNA helicase RuvB
MSNDPTPCSDVNSSVPRRLDQFVGQSSVVEQVRVALAACRNGGGSYPSSLFTGAPGLGKSQLVAILAAELGVPLRETLAQTIATTGDLRALLLDARDCEIVFLDEADELPPSMQTLLYKAMAERKLFVPRGHSGRQDVALPLDDFTLIMASNHESRLQRPLVERFKIINRFEFYGETEIERLLRDRAGGLNWQCHDGVFRVVAARSRGVPRTGLRLLETVHRVALCENSGDLTVAHVERACAIEGIDGRGLDRSERQYLRILDGDGGPVRPGVLADRLGVPLRTLQSVIEPFLIRVNLINRSDHGRTLTDDGVRYVREMTFSEGR